MGLVVENIKLGYATNSSSYHSASINVGKAEDILKSVDLGEIGDKPVIYKDGYDEDEGGSTVGAVFKAPSGEVVNVVFNYGHD